MMISGEGEFPGFRDFQIRFQPRIPGFWPKIGEKWPKFVGFWGGSRGPEFRGYLLGGGLLDRRDWPKVPEKAKITPKNTFLRRRGPEIPGFWAPRGPPGPPPGPPGPPDLADFDLRPAPPTHRGPTP